MHHVSADRNYTGRSYRNVTGFVGFPHRSLARLDLPSNPRKPALLDESGRATYYVAEGDSIIQNVMIASDSNVAMIMAVFVVDSVQSHTRHKPTRATRFSEATSASQHGTK